MKIPGGETYEKLHPREKDCESDAAIYYRLKGTCSYYCGNEKGGFPSYRVTDVRESM